MPTPRIEGSPAVIHTPDTEPQTPVAQQAGEALPVDAVETYFSPNAAFAAHEVESEFHAFFGPDMAEIDQKLTRLGGRDLKQALKTLDENGELDLIINRMSPAQRQDLMNAAIAGGLVEREGKNGKLVAKAPLSESFQQLIADMNAVGPNRKAETFYNWSANGEGAAESTQRSRHNQIKTLKPGDSVKLHQKASVSAQHTQVSLESATSISRDPDGKFRLAVDGKALVGPDLHAGQGAAKAKLEGGLGVGGRVEYTFATALEAELAAKEFAKDSVMAAKHYGTPAAIELRGEAAVELAAHLGTAKLQALELKAGVDGSMAMRLELDGKQPCVVLKATSRGEGMGALALHSNSFAAEVHGLDAKLESKTEVEVKIPISEPKALRDDPAGYLKEHGAELLAKAEFKFSASTELSAGHHGTATELSFKTDGKHMAEFVSSLGEQGLARSLHALSKEVEVEYREKDVELKHVGAKLGVSGGGAGFEVDAGFERKAFKNEREIFKGSGRELVTRPR